MLTEQKSELAAGSSYIASVVGAGVGTWLSEHWLQLASLFFMGLTYATTLYYKRRRDRRELQRHKVHLDKITDKIDSL